jgi:hypothetical protein
LEHKIKEYYYIRLKVSIGEETESVIWWREWKKYHFVERLKVSSGGETESIS